MTIRGQLIAAHLATAALGAQAPEAVFRAETTLVQIEVHATGRDGNPVGGLEKSDFELRENGQPREIVSVDYVPAVSRSESGILRPESPAEASQISPTRIYIETRTGEAQRMRVYRAIREFLDEIPTDAAVVSLRGTNFTSDPEELQETLDAMLRGRDGVPPLVDLEAAAMDAEIANLARDTGIFSPVVLLQPPPAQYTRRVALEAALLQGWITLVDELGVYPGKKMIVHFGRGMRYDAQNALLLDRLSEKALRSRVQIFTVDTRGLMAPIEGGEVYESPLYDPSLADRAVNRQDVLFSQSGMRMLAELTGGRAVVDNNDFGAVFERVVENLGGYYLLSYRPGDPDAKDHAHKLAVRAGPIRLDYLRSYRSEPAFADLTDKEKARKLQLSAASGAALQELPVAVGYELFLGADGRPVLAYSAGVACRDAPSTPEKKGRRIDLSVLALAQKMDANSPPQLVENRMTAVLKPAELERLRQDPSAYLQFSNRLALDPGQYRWRVVMRDEGTGAMGSYEARIDVPTFAEPASPSSLLLTTRVQPIDPGKRKADKNEAAGVNVAEVAFLAEAERTFQRGRTVYVVFGVYRLSQGLMDDPATPRVFLEREGVLLERPPFEDWQGFVETERSQVHVVARLNTAELEPGSYQLSVTLPDGKGRLTRGFRLTAPQRESESKD